MYLGDTSAWVDYLSRTPRAAGLKLRTLRERQTPVFLTGIVLQEILQGARNEAAFENYRHWLTLLPLVHPADPVATHTAAAQLYARLRWRGVTVRSAADCFIAQIAIEHDLTVLHDDSDYEKIAAVEPRLKLA